MGFDLASIFGTGIEKTITSLGDIADRFITTKEEKAQFKLEAEKVVLNASNEAREALQAELDSYLKDKQSARESQTRIQESEHSTWLGKNTIAILALSVTIGFFTLLGYMLMSDVPAANKDILNIMIGSLGTAWAGIISYYFGSSAGSQRNAEAIRQIAKS